MTLKQVSRQSGGLQRRIEDILSNVQSISPEVIGAAAVNMDGFVLASMLPIELDEELLSAMAATFLGAGEQMSESVMRSPLEQTYVKSEKGYVILNAIGEEAALAIVTKTGVKLGLVFYELKRNVIPELSKLLAREHR